MYQPKFQRQFIYHPKYWGIWLGVGLLKLISFLPYATRYRFGEGLGNLMRLFAIKRKKLVEANLKLAFPKLSSAERKQLSANHFKQLGISLIETTIAWWGDYNRNPHSPIRTWVEYQGLEHLEQAIQQGKGVLIVAPHFSTLEMTGLFISFKTHFNAVYRPHDNPLMDYLIAKGRAIQLNNGRQVHPIANNNTRAMLKVLRNGECMTILPDQRYRSRGHVEVNFMQQPAKSNPATSKLAKLTGCSVLACLTQRTADHRYIVRFLAPLDHFPSESLEQDTERLHQIYQQGIEQAPEQYLWVHNRWDLKWDKHKKTYKKNT